MLSNELTTKQEYQQALYLLENEIDKAAKDLNTSKRQKRECFAQCQKWFVKFDIKSQLHQEAYILDHNPDYKVIFDCYDENQEKLNALLRQREDVLKLMSFSQSEMRLI